MTGGTGSSHSRAASMVRRGKAAPPHVGQKLDVMFVVGLTIVAPSVLPFPPQSHRVVRVHLGVDGDANADRPTGGGGSDRRQSMVKLGVVLGTIMTEVRIEEHEMSVQ